MTIEEIRNTLHEAMKLRFPRFGPDDHPRDKVGKLEDYLGNTAFWRGELESALYWAREAHKILSDEWADVEGWQALRDRKTNEGVDEAKRRIKPEVWAGMDEAKRLIHDLGRQIRRLEQDFQAVSRDYTLITGS